jgi:hypothetical protein
MDGNDPFGDNDFGFSAPSTGNTNYGLNNLFGDEDLGFGVNPSDTSGYGLGNLFGDESFGFGTNPSDAPVSGFGAGNTFGDADLGFDSNLNADFSLDDINNFDFNSLGKGKGKGFNPVQAILNFGKAFTPPGVQAAIGLGQGLANGNPSSAVSQGFTDLTGNGMLGNIAGIASNGAQGNNSGASTALGMLGSMVAGPLGGMAGSAIGNGIFGDTPSSGPPPGVANGDGPSLDPGLLLGGLASLYQSNMMGNDAKTLAAPQAAQGIAGAAGVPTLESMFGADSAFAQNMRKQLERRDAAKGRRSQYGPREVELQAKLAEMQSRAAPDYIRAASAAQSANNTSSKESSSMQQAADQRRIGALVTLMKETGMTKQLGDLFRSMRPQAGGQLPEYKEYFNPAETFQPANPNFGIENVGTSPALSDNWLDY